MKIYQFENGANPPRVRPTRGQSYNIAWSDS